MPNAQRTLGSGEQTLAGTRPRPFGCEFVRLRIVTRKVVPASECGLMSSLMQEIHRKRLPRAQFAAGGDNPYYKCVPRLPSVRHPCAYTFIIINNHKARRFRHM